MDQVPASHLEYSVTIGTIGQSIFARFRRRDDRNIEVSKNNYSIMINIYSTNILSYISNHLFSPPYRVKNALSFVPIVTLPPEKVTRSQL